MQTSLYIETLKNKGYKLTRQRQRIVEILGQSGRRLSVREIHEKLRGEMPGVSLDTVYRNLRLLTVLKLVHQISLASGAVYEATQAEFHHHLVCTGCGKVACIDYSPDQHAYSEQARLHGFEVIGHIFEVQGRCSSCRR